MYATRNVLNDNFQLIFFEKVNNGTQQDAYQYVFNSILWFRISTNTTIIIILFQDKFFTHRFTFYY